MVGALIGVLLVGSIFVVWTTRTTDVDTDISLFPESPVMDRQFDSSIGDRNTEFVASSSGSVIMTHDMLSWQKETLAAIIRDIQPIPAEDGGNTYELLHTDAFIITYTATYIGEQYIVFQLLQTPLYENRTHAEQAFVALFHGERDDICGFPIAVYAPETHVLKDDLGIEQCDTSIITEFD